MNKRKPMTKEKYAEIIGKIKLNAMYLKSSSGEIDRDAFFQGKEAEHLINIIDEPSMAVKDNDTVDVIHRYCVEMMLKTAEVKAAGKIECAFCLNYSPASCFSPEFFEEFKKANLHINTWPFFREFVYNMTARMNIPPITLPLLKVRKKEEKPPQKKKKQT